ncbi:protein canopy 4 [Latimeria chalumnae]|uniref:Canopy FGF signaling regulator 4 n=1 Tax=Latimeria chalumnae TaxID=7897 RepID=H3A4A3_LATCH|nr:PREDICTED: protein canopy homolog 4 [Latimeria chalumnae]|eukprot:XP_006008490.1 PREDICTED: protein canopy homolog 4 [Latimeria chalumnae]
MKERVLLVFLCLISLSLAAEDEKLPNKCEVCKYLTLELETALEKTKHSKEVLELGQVLDSGVRKRKIQYQTSEMRLAEAMDNICERILEYNVHAERPGSLRFAKGQSETMATLKNLVNKGVKVELGIPYELWDEPSVEVTDMKKQCETMLEVHEEVVEDWYFHHQDQKLETFLCVNHALKNDEKECLEEVWPGKKGDRGKKEEKENDQEKRKTDQTKPTSESAQAVATSDSTEEIGSVSIPEGLHDAGEL